MGLQIHHAGLQNQNGLLVTKHPGNFTPLQIGEIVGHLFSLHLSLFQRFLFGGGSFERERRGAESLRAGPSDPPAAVVEEESGGKDIKRERGEEKTLAK